jgi:DNA-binding transcriptional regulator YiaG
MNCVQCNQLLARKVIPTYGYKASGLSNLKLHDIVTHECSACGDSLISFQCLGPLHREIAHALASKRTRLSIEEVRFLRDYLGWSNQEFASRMGVTPFHASRWTTKLQISTIAERLLRLLVLTGGELSKKRDRELRSTIEAFAAQPCEGTSKLEARFNGRTWHITVH